MARYDLQKMQKKLSKYLDSDRFEHTIGVMYTCAALAMAYDYDLEIAQLAGLMHDCAKCIPNKKKIHLCSHHNIPVTDFELKNPFLLHSKLGAYIAEKKYGVTEQNVLEAIKWHTTGKANMTILEKIVYIADYIEPHRYKAVNLDEIRALAFKDLDECMYRILEDTLGYLGADDSRNIDQASVDAFHYYEFIHQQKCGKE